MELWGTLGNLSPTFQVNSETAAFCSKNHIFAHCGLTASVGESIFWQSSFAWLILQLFFTFKVSKRPLRAVLCSKNHIFAHCGRAARAKWNAPIMRSYRGRDGSNEVSHTRTHPHTAMRHTTKWFLYIVWFISNKHEGHFKLKRGSLGYLTKFAFYWAISFLLLLLTMLSHSALTLA